MPRPVDTASLLRRLIRHTGVLTTTALTGALAIGLVISGAGFIGHRAESVELPATAPLVAVQAEPIRTLPGYQVTRAFVGQIEPRQQIDLAFEAGGTLAEVLVDEGARVTTDQVLARLDTRGLDARRTALVASRAAQKARLELAQLTAARKQELEKRGFAAMQAFDEARLSAAELTARIAETDAAIAGVDVQLDKAVLRAPFAGEIGTRLADNGQTVGTGAPVLSLLQSGAPLLRVGLPPQIAGGLQPGDAVTAHFGNTDYLAELAQLRPDLDPTTRTRSALFALRVDPGVAPPFGQSGSIALTQNVADPGVWVPLLALREGARGTWTVLTLSPNAGNYTVAIEAVELLHADADRAFVRSSFPSDALLVQAGRHRMTPGQTVKLNRE